MSFLGSLFGRHSGKAPIYILQDDDSRLLGRARLKEATAEGLCLELLEGEEERLRNVKTIQAAPADCSKPLKNYRLKDLSDGTLRLEQFVEEEGNLRRNFRVPVVFESYIYPEPHLGAAITSVDLSCGGIAFETNCHLPAGKRFEVVIPITLEAPLLLKGEVLRTRTDEQGRTIYATKFVDMIHDEEAMIREAVFAAQLNNARSARS